MPVTITELDSGLENLIETEGLVSGEAFYNTLGHAAKPEAHMKKTSLSLQNM